MLASWAFLLAAFSPKQEVFSKLVIALLAFPLNLPGFLMSAGGPGSGLRIQNLSSAPGHSAAGLPPPVAFGGGPLSHQHHTAAGT